MTVCRLPDNGLSATEEKVVEDQILHGKLFFNIPDALMAAGGTVATTLKDFKPYVNPPSDHPIAEKPIEALECSASMHAA